MVYRVNCEGGKWWERPWQLLHRGDSKNPQDQDCGISVAQYINIWGINAYTSQEDLTIKLPWTVSVSATQSQDRPRGGSRKHTMHHVALPWLQIGWGGQDHLPHVSNNHLQSYMTWHKDTYCMSHHWWRLGSSVKVAIYKKITVNKGMHSKSVIQWITTCIHVDESSPW